MPKGKAGGEDKPKSDGQEYLRWIQEELEATGNHLILLAFEDESAGREVNDRHPIFQTVGRIGHFQKFRDTKAFWRIEDGLIGRNPEACLAAIEDLWKPGKGDANVYGAVTRCLRFMLQANIGRERGRDGSTRGAGAVLSRPGAVFTVSLGGFRAAQVYGPGAAVSHGSAAGGV
jgi:hypothetical protein